MHILDDEALGVEQGAEDFVSFLLESRSHSSPPPFVSGHEVGLHPITADLSAYVRYRFVFDLRSFLSTFEGGLKKI